MKKELIVLLLSLCIPLSLAQSAPVITSITPEIVFNLGEYEISIEGQNLESIVGVELDNAYFPLSLFGQYTLSANQFNFTTSFAGLSEKMYDVRVVDNQQRKSNTLPLIILTHTGGPIPLQYKRDISYQNPDNTFPKIWFAPNVGGEDHSKFFTHPEEWENTRANIDVFRFHSVHFYGINLPPCNRCGNNSYQDLVNVEALNKLHGWDIKIGMGVEALKWHTCSGTQNALRTLRYIHNMYLAGGNITYLVIDEPFHGGNQVYNGNSCGLTTAEIGKEVADYLRIVKDVHPNIKIGDIEPYPSHSAEDLIEFVNEVASNGERFDFFQLDVNYPRFWIHGINPDPDMPLLKKFFSEEGIPYGVISWGAIPQTSFNHQLFYNYTLNWTSFVKNNSFEGDFHIFQSWKLDQNRQGTIPVNLPENDPNIYSMSRILLDGLAIIQDSNSTFISQSVPTSMIAGRSYPVTLTFQNTGDTIWDEDHHYRLTSTDSTNWGIDRAFISPFEDLQINTGGQMAFSFSITAPSTQGTYPFQWQMIHEGIEYFGDSSTLVNIQVTRSTNPNPDPNPDPNPNPDPIDPPINPINPPSPPINEEENESIELGDEKKELSKTTIILLAVIVFLLGVIISSIKLWKRSYQKKLLKVFKPTSE